MQHVQSVFSFHAPTSLDPPKKRRVRRAEEGGRGKRRKKRQREGNRSPPEESDRVIILHNSPLFPNLGFFRRDSTDRSQYHSRESLLHLNPRRRERRRRRRRPQSTCLPNPTAASVSPLLAACNPFSPPHVQGLKYPFKVHH